LQFGNGFSSTFAFEEPRNFGTTFPQAGIYNTQLGNFVLGNNTSDADRAKTRFPDIVQNWRVDQAWGSAQLMVAAHDASAGYYAAVPSTAAILAGSQCVVTATAAGTVTGSETCGHPADKLGWAVGGGARLNAYGGDYFQFQVNYTQGATRYAAFTNPGAMSPVAFAGQNLGYGLFSDGIFSTQTGEVQLTTVWGVNAAYDHLWLPNFRTSIYGSYIANRYNDAANTAICSAQQQTLGGAITFAPAVGALPGTSNVAVCNNNFNWWQIGSRTQYNFTPWFYVGFDVIYQKLETASRDAVVTYTAAANTAKPTAIYTIQDQDNYGLRIRVHRDIVP
jgi:hypothetical protein